MEKVEHQALQLEYVFFLVCDCLQVNQWMKLMQLNKQYKNLVENYCKYDLKRKGLLGEKYQVMDPNANDVKFNLIYKFLNNREVLYTYLQNPINYEDVSQIKVYRNRNQSILAGRSIHKFNIGQKFCTFLTQDHQLVICKTDEFFNAAKFDFIVKQKVRQYSVRSRNLVYLNSLGQMYIIFYDRTIKIEEMIEVMVPFSQYIPVEKMRVSYDNLICYFVEKLEDREKNAFLLERLVKGQQFEYSENEYYLYKQSQIDKKLDKNILIFKVSEMQPDEIRDKQRYKKVLGYENKDILEFCVGYSHSYIVSPENVTYSIDLTNYTNQGGFELGHIQIQVFQPLKVYCGLFQYFAIELDYTEPYEKWNNDQVLKFAAKNKLDDYLQIFKYQQVTGQTLKNSSFDELLNQYGIDKEHYAKMVYELGNYKKTKLNYTKLYGWGKNESGQLGLYNQGQVMLPVSVQLPSSFQNQGIQGCEEWITKIVCGWKQSTMITNLNNIFITKFNNAKKEQVIQDEEFKQENTDKRKKQKKNKDEKLIKQSQKKKQQIQEEKKEIETHRWLDITESFKELKDKRKYKFFDISISRDYFSVLAACYETKDLAILKDIVEGEKSHKTEQGSRLTPSNEIFKRIQWDPSLDKNDFSIVYEDRFLGNLEISFEEYEMAEIKAHRINYFKYKDNIVWDRANRINQFKTLFQG